MNRDTTSHALAVKFSAMPDGVRNRWLKWARSHDWCLHCFLDETGKLAVASWDYKTGGNVERFSNPQELRDWAGY